MKYQLCLRNIITNSAHHSHIEKKIDLPDFNKASLIGGYLIYTMYESSKYYFLQNIKYVDIPIWI